ncbi:MAG: hypothetical protein IPP81_20305 [Chitinophagaceae bacterium]|nr:hypothetical protein [Chitinophagaceae bacterium]
MTKLQIDILLKDNDIALSDFLLNEHRNKQHVTDAKTGKEYAVSVPVFQVIRNIFSQQLNFEVYEGHEVFKTSLENKINLISPLQQDKIEFYRTSIKEENNKLTYLNGGNFYSTIPNLVSRKFSSIFFNNGLSWIKCLKFEVLKGKSIQSLKPSDPNLYILRELIFESEMDDLFKMVAIVKNISYLQILIAENANQSTLEVDNKTITNRLKAIAYIFNQHADQDKYPLLVRGEIRKKDTSFHDALDDLEYFPDIITKKKPRKKPYKPYTYADLEKVESFNLVTGKALFLLLKEKEKLKNKV